MNKKYNIETLIKNFKENNKIALARLISIVENNPDRAEEVFKHFNGKHHDSYIIGITGSPGVGKSTLTGSIAKILLDKGKKVGIISVDPTSPFSGGAFLGDRVRMPNITLHPNLFMRSLASRSSKGGLSRAVFDIILLYEAFDIDIILIETVGAGQSEFDIYNIAHTIVVVLVPGYGDTIQMQKAGIIEIGDIYDVNKKDLGGEDVAVQVEMMLDDSTFQHDWRPPVVMTNSLSGEGVNDLLEHIFKHREHMKKLNLMEKKKNRALNYKMRELFLQEMERELSKVIKPEEFDKISTEIGSKKFHVHNVIKELFRSVHITRRHKDSSEEK
ncbi:MAG: methylmalonyl Co-A mutase-associated GTPase MeaB [Candidatus Lokiarchaeota archaeon]|nr:methylmalonyl Co-A mutase-associated GTPase MeaB [Candidatus Lokiarchaeota archaeon]